jgi:hypothetical protein
MGPTVWELDGPMPIENKSKMLISMYYSPKKLSYYYTLFLTMRKKERVTRSVKRCYPGYHCAASLTAE